VTLGRALRPGRERRSSTRRPVDRVFLHGTVVSAAYASGIRVHLVCVDISSDGCGALAVGRPLTEGDVVRLVLAPSVSTDDGVQARVTWVEREGEMRWRLGFRFEELATRERERVREWCNWWNGTAPRERVREETARLGALNAAIRQGRARQEGEERRRF
jgi:hypothetical protein